MLKIIYSKLTLGLIIFVMGCTPHTIVRQDSYRDTTMLSLVSARGLNLSIGDSLVLPGVRIIRISEGQALVESNVRILVQKEILTIETKSIDKSDNRIYTDSKNKDKSVNAPRKVKSVDKTDNSVTKRDKSTNFPWWWWLIIVLGVLIWLAFRYIRKVWLP